jgi:hypothetical protein
MQIAEYERLMPREGRMPLSADGPLRVANHRPGSPRRARRRRRTSNSGRPGARNSLKSCDETGTSWRVAARSRILRRPVDRSRRGWQRDHFPVDLKLLLTVDSRVGEFLVDHLECVLARDNGELPVWPALACGDVVREYVQLSVVQFE